jgi:hypothetical protein
LVREVHTHMHTSQVYWGTVMVLILIGSPLRRQDRNVLFQSVPSSAREPDRRGSPAFRHGPQDTWIPCFHSASTLYFCFRQPLPFRGFTRVRLGAVARCALVRASQDNSQAQTTFRHAFKFLVRRF